MNSLDFRGEVPDSSRKEYYKNRRARSLSKSSKQLRVTIMTEGQIFGERDFVFNKTSYSYTVK